MFEDRASEDLGTDLEEGHDPFGDADPGACQADPLSCDIGPAELDGPPERSEVAFMEEVMEPFVPERQVFVKHPVDGMPVPVESQTLAEAPKFTYESFVCVGDERSFVEVFDDELSKDENEAIERMAQKIFTRYKFDANGQPKRRIEFAPDRIVTIRGMRFVLLTDEEHAAAREVDDGAKGPSYVPVRPLRERCKHLTAQIFNHDGIEPGEPNHFIVFRNCSVRRSVGGAMMTLRDQAVYACTLREPRDPESEERHIYGPEKGRLNQADKIARLPMFHDGGGSGLPEPTVQ